MGLDKCFVCNDCDFLKEISKAKNIYDIPINKFTNICITDLTDKDYSSCKDHVENSFIRLSRHTSSVFRNISVFISLYNDIVAEMISNHTSYPDIIFYILDSKFVIWKRWLELLLFWNRYLGVRCKTCENYELVVSKVTDMANDYCNSVMKDIPVNDEYEKTIRDYFLETHKYVYSNFKKELLSRIFTPRKNGEYHRNMRTITDVICSWMQVTLFELLSIESIIKENKAIISGAIISKALDGFNLIDIFRKQGLVIKDFIFTSPDLYKYKYMFIENNQN